MFASDYIDVTNKTLIDLLAFFFVFSILKQPMESLCSLRCKSLNLDLYLQK